MMPDQRNHRIVDQRGRGARRVLRPCARPNIEGTEGRGGVAAVKPGWPSSTAAEVGVRGDYSLRGSPLSQMRLEERSFQRERCRWG